jgi:hypothetical protein
MADPETWCKHLVTLTVGGDAPRDLCRLKLNDDRLKDEMNQEQGTWGHGNASVIGKGCPLLCDAGFEWARCRWSSETQNPPSREFRAVLRRR